jgi:tetratricopeptide (TPR) repeat protein
MPERGLSAENPALPEKLSRPMPDDGPRLEGQSSGIDGLAWQEGLSAYKKRAWPEARRFFEKLLREHADSSLIPSVQAFWVELSLQEDSSGASRSQAIEEYKKLLRDHPQSSNARRAEWRMADLYFEQGAFQEAQAFYEQAMAHSLTLLFDNNRALLGLGHAFMAMGKWSDAEHAFANVRRQSDHEQILQGATLGLAHAFFRQQRFSEALPFYNLSYRRWPSVVKGDPLAMQRYAATEVQLHHEASARELMALFYNLFPHHDYAPTALLHIAESLQAISKPSLAEFFYALVPSLYPQSPQVTAANLRLGALRAEQMLPAGENWVGLSVSAMIHNVPVPDQTDVSYRGLLETIVTREAASPIGGEALFYLGNRYERVNDVNRALRAYKEATIRPSKDNDRWATKAAERLSDLLTPWIESAVASRDDLMVVSLFHRYGVMAEQRYAHSPLLLEIAESHRRLGFSHEAIRLHQQVVKANQDAAFLEPALIGLGKVYLDQRDPEAARKVLERYRFQFPLGKHEGEALHLLIDAMWQQRDLQGLLHLCRAWLPRHPNHHERPAIYLQLAKTLGELEKLDESVLAYEEAFKSDAAQSPDTLLSYADSVSRLNRHERAIAAYQTVLNKNPTVPQAEWAHLQTAKHWTALKQYERAIAALAELDVTDDRMVTRLSASLKAILQESRRVGTAEEL